MDFALVILVFLGIGWLIDRAADTRPVFMIACTVFAVAGQFVRMWYEYDGRMRRLEDERADDRHRAPRATVVVEDLAHEPLHIPVGFADDDRDRSVDRSDATSDGANA